MSMTIACEQGRFGNRRTSSLDAGFECLIDTVIEDDWNELISLFDDATMNQMWSWCHVMSKETSSFVLRRGGVIVGAAMLRLIRIPMLGAGVAYIGAGPMWRRRGSQEDMDVLHNLLRGLREEYVSRRRLLLRISPNMYTNLSAYEEIVAAFRDEGFSRKNTEARTLLLDLRPSLEALRDGLHPKWRNMLNSAEKNGFSIRHGRSDELFGTFRSIYREMVYRKRYTTDVALRAHAMVQSQLPEHLKLEILLCEKDAQPLAGAVFSTVGNTSVYLLGATTDQGLKNKASYIVQWEIIKLLKERCFLMYDLGGCSPGRVPGTYLFKSRMCGKKPEVYSQIGVMEACDALRSRFVVRSGEMWNNLRRWIIRLRVRKDAYAGQE